MIAERILMIPCRSRSFCALARPLALAASCSLGLATSGCQPKLDPQEYGEVVTELPYVPGTEKPYRLPELEQSPDETKDGSTAGQK